MLSDCLAEMTRKDSASKLHDTSSISCSYSYICCHIITKQSINIHRERTLRFLNIFPHYEYQCYFVFMPSSPTILNLTHLLYTFIPSLDLAGTEGFSLISLYIRVYVSFCSCLETRCYRYNINVSHYHDKTSINTYAVQL